MNEGHVYHATQSQQNSLQSEGAQLSPYSDMVEYFQEYAKERPEVVALWCFGIGFVLGWKLKPW